MARLVFTTNAASYQQLDAITGTLSIDTEGEAFGAAHIRAYFPGYAFDTVTVDRLGFQGPGDTYAPPAPAPTGEYNMVEVACSTDQAPSGIIPILSFDARVTGARGTTADLVAEFIDAFTIDGGPMLGERAELSLDIASGNAGFRATLLPDAQATLPYHAVISGQGGVPPYTFSLAQGSLPSGLTLEPQGIISGTPSFVGSSPVTLRITDAGLPPSPAVEAAFTVRVVQAPPRVLTDTLPLAGIGRAYSADLVHDGGTAPVRWEADSLPPGLTVSGNRIVGTPVADRHTVGVYTVRLRVIDALADARIAERDVGLTVLPALPAAVDVPSPGDVTVAPDMLVVPYSVALTANGSLAQADEEIVRAHDMILESLMSDVFNLTFDEVMGGLLDPRSPDQPAGDPAERQRIREVLGILLHEYKEVKQAGQEATPVGVYASLYVDEVFVTHVGSWRRGVKGADWNMRHSMARTEPRTKRHRDAHSAFARAMKKDPKGFSRWMLSMLDRVLRHGEASDFSRRSGPRRRSSARGSNRSLAYGMPRPKSEIEDLVQGRVADFRGALDRLGIDLRDYLDPEEGEGRAVLNLTPGAHRVRVTWSVSSFVAPGSIVGLMEAAGAQAGYSVTFKPKNPHHWPRLDGETAVGGGGGRSGSHTQDVSLVGSDQDVLVVSGGSVRLIAATGLPTQPFADPVHFQPLANLSPSRVCAQVADDIGRTSVAAIEDDIVYAALNKGPGGFAPALTDPGAIGSATYRDVTFGPRAEEGRSSIYALTPNQIVKVTATENEPGQVQFRLTPSVSDLAPHLRTDSASSVTAQRLASGAARLFVCEEWAGAVDEYEVTSAGSLTRIDSLTGTSSLDPRRDPVSVIAGTFAPAVEMVAASLSQASALHAWRRTGTTWTALAPLRFPFRTGQITRGMGINGGVAVLSRAGGHVVLVWWPAIDEEARLIPVHIGGVATAIAASDMQLAIAYRTVDRLEIFRPA